MASSEQATQNAREQWRATMREQGWTPEQIAELEAMTTSFDPGVEDDDTLTVVMRKPKPTTS